MGVSIISALESYLEAFDFSALLDIAQGVIPALICITLHELSHGLVAYLLGDETAKRAGRLTLNPMKHLDFFGLAMMVAAHVGWAKPVPVNMYNFKNPKRGMAITAAAGPLSNIIIAIVFFFLYGFTYPFAVKSGTQTADFFFGMIGTTAIISVGYAVFNIIPIPPLDGSKVLFSIVGDETYRKLMHYERYGIILLYALVFTRKLSGPLNIAISFVTDKLYVFADLGYKLSFNLFFK